MTIEDIFNLNINPEFGADDYNNETDVIEEVCDQITNVDPNCEMTYGASKFVIFLNEREVVKIPFNGCYYNDDEEDSVFDYYNNTDYCSIEERIYEDAVSARIEMFFAGTHYAGQTKSGKAVYISERVYPYNSEQRDNSPKPSADSLKKAESFDCSLSYDWLARAIEYYGEKLVQAFVQFIKDEEINDLHNGNIGVRADGAPVLLDYSGFMEE